MTKLVAVDEGQKNPQRKKLTPASFPPIVRSASVRHNAAFPIINNDVHSERGSRGRSPWPRRRLSTTEAEALAGKGSDGAQKNPSEEDSPTRDKFDWQ